MRLLSFPIDLPSFTGGDSLIYTGSGEPPQNLNPQKVGAVYIDTTNKKAYICVDNTENNNIWIPVGLSIQGSGVSVIMSDSNPTVDVNPTEDVLWVNKTTGEIFICACCNTNKNIWIGNKGTTVAPLFPFDFFGDGSAVAFYRFDGSPADDGGQYNGTWYGVEKYTIGKAGKAADFYDPTLSTSSGVTIPFDIVGGKSITLTESYSFSAWFKYEHNEIINAIPIIQFGGHVNNISMGLVNGYARMHVENSDHRVYVDGTTNIAKNSDKWFHVVGVYDVENDELRIYVNGQLEGKTTLNGLRANTGSGEACVGSTRSYTGIISVANGSPTTGAVDHLRIFKKALTDQEVQTLAQEVGC